MLREREAQFYVDDLVKVSFDMFRSMVMYLYRNQGESNHNLCMSIDFRWEIQHKVDKNREDRTENR